MRPLDHSRLNIAVTYLLTEPADPNRILDVVTLPDNDPELVEVLDAFRVAFKERGESTLGEIAEKLQEGESLAQIRAGRALAWGLGQMEIGRRREAGRKLLGLVGCC